MSRAGWILLAVGGTAAVGVAYALTRPKAAPAGPAPPAPPQTPAQAANVTQPSPILIPQTKYAMTFKADTSISVVTGDSVRLDPPGPPPAGQQWMFSFDQGLTAIQWGPNTTPNTQTTYDYGIFTATSAGRWQVDLQSFTPGAGGNADKGKMLVVVSQAQQAPQL